SGPDPDPGMPRKRDPLPAPLVLPCEATFPAIRPIPVETACALSKPARYVVFCSLVARRGEDFFRLIELNQLTKKKEAGIFRHSGRLLHIMRHNHDRVMFLELKDQFLDLACGDGI